VPDVYLDACRGAITSIAQADIPTSVQFDATSQSSSASPAASGGVAGELDCCSDKCFAVGMRLCSQYKFASTQSLQQGNCNLAQLNGDFSYLWWLQLSLLHEHLKLLISLTQLTKELSVARRDKVPAMLLGVLSSHIFVV